jgi:glyoxylase I family protein
VRFQSVVAYPELLMTEVTGIDHIYVTVSDLVKSERFYDRVLGVVPYAAGLHHFCFRVDSKTDVQAVANELRIQGIDATAAKLYPQYAPDYMATFFEDPDGIRLEVTNYRQERRDRHDLWDEQRG